MSEPASPRAGRRRRRALTTIAVVVAASLLAYLAWWVVVLRQVERTDNAYVQGPLVQITAQVPGTVVAVLADDTDRVVAGQVLVRLDAADARVGLQQAEAQLAQAVREARVLYANNSTLAAQVGLREAEQARARTELARARDDLARRAPLLASGAVAEEEVAHARAQVGAAQEALAAAQAAELATREQLAANQAMTAGTPVEQHPSVQRAAARLREAWLALRRVELPAPQAGVIARRSVQLGQRVAAGAPLMTLVSLDSVWVDANFKEGQLDRIRVGQPATAVADVYGSRVEYPGRVVGLGAGTGAAFALLPAQNATGNWIKVVQRVPVRIALDPQALAAHPLRVGLSMQVQVDVADRGGAALAEPAAAAAAARTAVFDEQAGEADAVVQRVVRAHLGPPVRGATR